MRYLSRRKNSSLLCFRFLVRRSPRPGPGPGPGPPVLCSAAPGLRTTPTYYPPATPSPIQFPITQALGSHLNFNQQPSTVRVVISSSSSTKVGIQLSRLASPRIAFAISQPSPFLKHKSSSVFHSRLQQKALDQGTSLAVPLSQPPSPVSSVPVPPLRSTCQYLGSSPGSTCLCKLGPSIRLVFSSCLPCLLVCQRPSASTLHCNCIASSVSLQPRAYRQCPHHDHLS